MSEYVYATDEQGGHWLTGEEIVRCRDCEYFESDYSDGAMFDASVCWGWDNGHDYPCFTHPDGFCHRGGRRVES